MLWAMVIYVLDLNRRDKNLTKLIARLIKIQDENLGVANVRELQAYVKVKKPEMLALLDEAFEKHPSLSVFVVT